MTTDSKTSIGISEQTLYVDSNGKLVWLSKEEAEARGYHVSSKCPCCVKSHRHMIEEYYKDDRL